MRSANARFARLLDERAQQSNFGSTARGGHQLDLPQRTLSNPGAQRLQTRFFRGEARGQRILPINAACARGELTRREDLRLDLREDARPVRDFDDVESDPDNHARRAASGIRGCVTRRTELSAEGVGPTA